MNAFFINPFISANVPSGYVDELLLSHMPPEKSRATVGNKLGEKIILLEVTLEGTCRWLV